MLQNNVLFCIFAARFFATTLTRGVIGNTSDFGSEESRFEPWRVNLNEKFRASSFILMPRYADHADLDDGARTAREFIRDLVLESTASSSYGILTEKYVFDGK